MTPEQISKLGRRKLNKALAIQVFPNGIIRSALGFEGVIVEGFGAFDYESLTVIMPLAIEAKVGLLYLSISGFWMASSNPKPEKQTITVELENPYRALAECLLLVKQGESNED